MNSKAVEVIEMDSKRDVKQEIVDIPLEDTYYEVLKDLTNIDDGLVLSYITHKCICCDTDIERYTFDKHMLEVHKVKIFIEGIKVSFTD